MSECLTKKYKKEKEYKKEEEYKKEDEYMMKRRSISLRLPLLIHYD